MPIFIGNTIANKRNSWSSYWKTQNNFYELWKITGAGNLVGLKRGDILTVGGSTGSYTFQVPNTAAYQTRDTDYIFFKRSTTQRTATEAELVGYDFEKVIVKFLGTSPNSIEYVGILDTGQSVTDRMKDDFKLSVWWSGLLSSHGEVKSNRGAYQNSWNVPYLMKDGNNIGTYFYDESATITKDGANKIAQISDFIGDGHNLTQSDDTKKITWAADGFTVGYGAFRMVTDAFVLSPPITIYMYVKTTAWYNAMRFFNGLSDTLQLLQNGVTPQIKAGLTSYFSALTSDMAVDQWVLLTIQFNVSGINSFLQINDNVKIEWNLPNGINMGGIGMFNNISGNFSMNGKYKGIVWRKKKDTDSDIVVMKNYIKERYQ